MRKVQKTFKLDPKVIKVIQILAEKDNRPLVNIVENAVMSLANVRLSPEELLEVYQDSFIDKTKN